MAETNKKVLFKFGTRAEYNQIPSGQILNNALYFLLDTNELYRGSTPIGQSHYYEGQIINGQTHEQAIAAAIGVNVPAVNDILILTTQSNIKYPYIYTAIAANNSITYEWKPLYGKVDGNEIIFDDGETLLEKLSQGSLDYSAFDDDVFSVLSENNEPVGITLKDFGVKYYDYVDGEYVVVQVDNDHPWISGLVPRVVLENGRPVLGWFVPAPDSASGQEIDLTNIRQDITDLKTLIGKYGSNGQPSTGLIHTVESKISSVQVGDNVLTPVDGTINLPIFNGSNNGVVPKPNANLDSLRVLGSNGQWLDPNELFYLEWEELVTN